MLFSARQHGAPIGSQSRIETWQIEWSRDPRRHVLKSQSRHPDMFKA